MWKPTMLRISPMSSSPTTCGVVMASVSLRRGMRSNGVARRPRAGSRPRALRLELLQPFDLAAVGFDPARDDEGCQGHQDGGCQRDALPQIGVGVKNALRHGADQLPTEG